MESNAPGEAPIHSIPPDTNTISLPQSLTLSEYAEKYGASKEPWLVGTGKSGLTPLPITYSRSPTTLMIRHAVHEYQKHETSGFKVRDLIASGATYEENVNSSNLTAIHPLFDRQNWLTSLPAHLAFYPLDYGFPGYWRADNDIVWNLLIPVLTLASKLMWESNNWPWWDTLLFGEIKTLQSQEFSSILPNLLPSRGRRNVVFHTKILEYAKKIRFSMSSGHCSPESGMPRHGSSWHGITAGWLSQEGYYQVDLAIESLTPLLSATLTQSEKIMIQFRVAITLVHELAHALWSVRCSNLRGASEPYYRDEPIAELGHSMTNAVLGGVFSSALDSRSMLWDAMIVPPMSVIFSPGWPGLFDARHTTLHRPCLDPLIRNGIGLREFWALPVSWMADVQQESYWNIHFRTFGNAALTPEPLLAGVRITRTGTKQICSRVIGDVPNLSENSQHSSTLRRSRIAKAAQVRRLLDGYLLEDIAEQEAINAIYGVATPFHNISIKNCAQDPVTGELSFRPIKDFELDFDVNMKKPVYWQIVDKILLDNRYLLKLDTMTEYTPVSLLLDYINRNLPLDKPKLAISHLKEYLTGCQVKCYRFSYRRKGFGVVKKRFDASWSPPISPLYGAIPSDQPVLQASLTSGDFAIFSYIRDIILVDHGVKFLHKEVGGNFVPWDIGFELRDYDEILLFERKFRPSLERYIQVHETPQRDITRYEFLYALRYFYTCEVLFAPGPPGIARRINNGWPTSLMSSLSI